MECWLRHRSIQLVCQRAGATLARYLPCRLVPLTLFSFSLATFGFYGTGNALDSINGNGPYPGVLWLNWANVIAFAGLKMRQNGITCILIALTLRSIIFFKNVMSTAVPMS